MISLCFSNCSCDRFRYLFPRAGAIRSHRQTVEVVLGHRTLLVRSNYPRQADLTIMHGHVCLPISMKLFCSRFLSRRVARGVCCDACVPCVMMVHHQTVCWYVCVHVQSRFYLLNFLPFTAELHVTPFRSSYSTMMYGACSLYSTVK